MQIRFTAGNWLLQLSTLVLSSSLLKPSRALCSFSRALSNISTVNCTPHHRFVLQPRVESWPTTIEDSKAALTARGDTEVRHIPIRCIYTHALQKLMRPSPNPDDDDHYDRRQQRRRIDSAPPPVRLRRQLLSIADSPLRRWGEEVQSIARLLADNYDDENLRNTFVNLALQLVVEQPLKTPFVAAVVLVANTLKPEIVDAILTLATQETESKIAKGEWKHVKLYLKFLACLQACLQGDGIFPLLEELFSRAADLQTASSEDVGCPSFSLSKMLHLRSICSRTNTYLSRQSARKLSRSFCSRFLTSWPLLPANSSRRRQISWTRPISSRLSPMRSRPWLIPITPTSKMKAHRHL